MKKVTLLGLIILALVSAVFIYQKMIFTRSLQSTFSDPGSKKIQVTTSFYPLYFFASQIGADMADVKNITPAGVEPHDYDPSTSDIARIEESDILILNGGIEPWADKIRENLRATQVVIVVAGEGLMKSEVSQEGTTRVDPHVWLSPQLAKKEVNKIMEGLIKADPKNSSYFQANEKKLEDKLDQLDQKYKQGLINCQQKNIVTSHVAFGYLTDAYGLIQISISGLSPDSEPSTARLAEVVKFAKAHGVKYIFFEKLVSSKFADTIATETGAKTLVLDPLEGLSGEDIIQGNNYFSVMEENLKNLQIALQCNS